MHCAPSYNFWWVWPFVNVTWAAPAGMVKFNYIYFSIRRTWLKSNFVRLVHAQIMCALSVAFTRVWDRSWRASGFFHVKTSKTEQLLYMQSGFLFFSCFVTHVFLRLTYLARDGVARMRELSPPRLRIQNYPKVFCFCFCRCGVGQSKVLHATLLYPELSQRSFFLVLFCKCGVGQNKVVYATLLFPELSQSFCCCCVCKCGVGQNKVLHATLLYPELSQRSFLFCFCKLG